MQEMYRIRAAVFLCCMYTVYTAGTVCTEDAELLSFSVVCLLYIQQVLYVQKMYSNVQELLYSSAVHVMDVQHILCVQKMYTKCTGAAVFLCCMYICCMLSFSVVCLQQVLYVQKTYSNVQELLYSSAVHLMYVQHVLYVQKMYSNVQQTAVYTAERQGPDSVLS